MNNRLVYILSVGLAFYTGMKMPKKPVIKTVEKIVKVESGASKTILSLRDELKECISSHDELVDRANEKVKELEAQVETCEEKYYQAPTDYPKKNLEPETVKEKEPELGDNYDQ